MSAWQLWPAGWAPGWTAAAASLGLLLALPGRARLDARRGAGARADPIGPPLRAVATVVGAVGLLGLMVARPRMPVAALLVIVGLLAGAAVLLARGRRRDGQARRTRGQVIELCEAIAAELAAGASPSVALGVAAQAWSAVVPVAVTAQVGGDIPAALRRLGAAPGGGSLRVVAAAWEVAHRTGHGLGEALSGVAEQLRAVERTRRVVASELASARATARLLSLLPVPALAMGSGIGARDPWLFLVAHPVGLLCLAMGLGLVVAGLAWIDVLARGVENSL